MVKFLALFRVLTVFVPPPCDKKERMKIDVGQKSGCGIRAVKGRVGYHISHAENADSVTAAQRVEICKTGQLHQSKPPKFSTALYRLAVGRGRFENPTRPVSGLAHVTVDA